MTSKISPSTTQNSSKPLNIKEVTSTESSSNLLLVCFEKESSDSRVNVSLRVCCDAFHSAIPHQD